ncbi:unnamed protein product [Symbiodinium sp. KB8]|nr:unnamed protein product [Symbiodinium sp. KB8]
MAAAGFREASKGVVSAAAPDPAPRCRGRALGTGTRWRTLHLAARCIWASPLPRGQRPRVARDHFEPLRASRPLILQAGKLDDIAVFVASEVDNDLSSVPGVGPVTVTAFGKVGITSTTQLIGKFLLMVDGDEDDGGRGAAVRERAPELFERGPSDRYVDWLRALGVMNNWVNVITYAIAGKADALIPGTFTVRA